MDTQSVIMTSSCKQETDKRKNYDARERQTASCKERILLRNNFTLSLAKALFLTIIVANFVAVTSACPSECSCAVEGTAFCNNKRLNKTPLGFTMTVELLYLFNNNITRILPGTLQPLKNLKLLDLSGNRITNYALWDGVFNKLNRLENLMLQENRITRINKGMFKGLTNLARIYLHDNEISSIDDGAFSNLPNLVELKLRNNRLSSFPRLQNTPSLLLLDLGFNRLTSIRDMALSTVNLEHLKLQGNKLTQLRTSVFDDTSRLTHLDISDNRLTAVPLVVKSLSTLRFLNMSLNQVGTIPGDTFRRMNRLKVLDLHGMGLTALPFGIIPPRVILNVLDITGNTWDCGCSSHWLPEYLRIFEMAFVNPDEIVCSGDSKQAGRRLKELEEGDFECTKEEKAEELTPVTKPTTTTTLPRTKQPWSADPCEVYPCFNGGSCFISGHHPKCRCTRHWSGPQCQRSLTTTTPTKRTTSRTTTTVDPLVVLPPAKPRLLINEDSITESSVEIILPKTETELIISITEIERRQMSRQLRIKPTFHPFTVTELESGKSYNICIYLPLREKQDHYRRYVDVTDTLCGSVRTRESKTINPAIVPTKIKVPTQTDRNSEGKTPIEKADFDERPDSSEPGIEDRLHGEAEREASESEGFDIVYPAVGAGIGAVVIIAVLILLVCYKRRRNQKLKHPENLAYIAGSTAGTCQIADLEQPPVVHHLHSHYNVGNADPNSRENNFNSKNPAPKAATPNEVDSMSRSSDCNSSNSDTVLTCYADSPLLYSTQQYVATSRQPYEQAIQQRNGRASDYVCLNHQNNNASVMASQSTRYAPMDSRYELEENINNMRPLGGNVTQGFYTPESHPMRHGPRPTSLLKDCAPPVSYAPPYPQASSRSAFHPVQNSRNVVDRAPDVRLSAHCSGAPTSQYPVRNHIVDKPIGYHKGVPVV